MMVERSRMAANSTFTWPLQRRRRGEGLVVEYPAHLGSSLSLRMADDVASLAALWSADARRDALAGRCRFCLVDPGGLLPQSCGDQGSQGVRANCLLCLDCRGWAG